MDDRTYELLMLGGTLAVLTLLLPWRRKKTPVPWTAILIAAIGIVVLVLNALRQSIFTAVPDAGAWLDPGNEKWSVWRFAELGGLLIVGVGVIMLAQTAEHERTESEKRRRLGALAPVMDISEPMLCALIQSTPGTVLLLNNQAATGEDPRFHVAFADGSSHGLSRKVGASGGKKLLTEMYPTALAERIHRVAKHAMLSGGVHEESCRGDVTGRWYTFSAAAHGQSVIVVFEDVTERRQVEESLRRVAFTDTVTGLANRAMLENELRCAIESADADDPQRFAVIYIDFDGFKRVNDDHGHHVGDALLASIAQRLSDALDSRKRPRGVSDTAARWGGDEFVVLLRESRLEEIGAFAEQLVRVLAEPHDLGDTTVTSTASVGVAVYSGQYDSLDAIIRDADAAMYEAKRQGRNRVIRAEEVATRPKFKARRSEDWRSAPPDEPTDRSRLAG